MTRNRQSDYIYHVATRCCWVTDGIRWLSNSSIRDTGERRGPGAKPVKLTRQPICAAHFFTALYIKCHNVTEFGTIFCMCYKLLLNKYMQSITPRCQRDCRRFESVHPLFDNG